jgi:ABC-2 type transport system ATP-binding protein
MSDTILQVDKLAKTFPGGYSPRGRFWGFRRHRITALRDISFQLEAGTIMGLVGPNGSGKTTMLRILADRLRPDRGRVYIDGQWMPFGRALLGPRMGYVSSDRPNVGRSPIGRCNAGFFARLRGVSQTWTARCDAMIQEFGLISESRRPPHTCSAGAKKKLAVIQALLHRPVVMLLDDVTNNLDVPSARFLKAYIQRYVSTTGAAAIWSSHRAEEISELCDRVLVLDNGRTVSTPAVNGTFDLSTPGTPEFLLKVKDMNGQGAPFYQRCTRLCNTSVTKRGDISEFAFKGISEDKFGQIVSLAVRDYGAFVLFAGCLNKE